MRFCGVCFWKTHYKYLINNNKMFYNALYLKSNLSCWLLSEACSISDSGQNSEEYDAKAKKTANNLLSPGWKKCEGEDCIFNSIFLGWIFQIEIIFWLLVHFNRMNFIELGIDYWSVIHVFILWYADADGAYYWHIKSGTIQRDPPDEFQPTSPLAPALVPEPVNIQSC